MEIKDIKPTAEAKFKVRATDGGEQSVAFVVRYIGTHQIPDYLPKGSGKLRQSQVITDALVDAVEGWDLTHDGGKPLDCTEANKRKYFPYILGLKIIREGESEDSKISPDDILGLALVEFAGDAGNFLKN
jgi:hypothetical protein